jgi:hypothetical protein
MRISARWTVGEWTFYQVDDHGFTGQRGDDRPFYGFSTGPEVLNRMGLPKFGELYATLEYAMAAAIAEKYTGPRGAGGSGVDTAAGWFMRMIGADLPTLTELTEHVAKHPSIVGATEDAGFDMARVVLDVAAPELGLRP